MSSSLYQYNDKLENYCAWQSFRNATQGLGLTATAQLDLVTRWLGRESSNQVKRLQLVHIAILNVALQKACQHLQESYAVPEIVKKALFS